MVAVICYKIHRMQSRKLSNNRQYDTIRVVQRHSSHKIVVLWLRLPMQFTTPSSRSSSSLGKKRQHHHHHQNQHQHQHCSHCTAMLKIVSHKCHRTDCKRSDLSAVYNICNISFCMRKPLKITYDWIYLAAHSHSYNLLVRSPQFNRHPRFISNAWCVCVHLWAPGKCIHFIIILTIL